MDSPAHCISSREATSEDHHQSWCTWWTQDYQMKRKPLLPTLVGCNRHGSQCLRTVSPQSIMMTVRDKDLEVKTPPAIANERCSILRSGCSDLLTKRTDAIVAVLNRWVATPAGVAWLFPGASWDLKKFVNKVVSVWIYPAMQSKLILLQCQLLNSESCSYFSIINSV